MCRKQNLGGVFREKAEHSDVLGEQKQPKNCSTKQKGVISFLTTLPHLEKEPVDQIEQDKHRHEDNDSASSNSLVIPASPSSSSLTLSLPRHCLDTLLLVHGNSVSVTDFSKRESNSPVW